MNSTPHPRSRSRAAVVAGCSYIAAFIAGTTTYGTRKSKARNIVPIRSSAMPAARRLIVFAVAGQRTTRSARRTRWMWSIIDPGANRVGRHGPAREPLQRRRPDELERSPRRHGLHGAAGLDEPRHDVARLVGGDRAAQLEQDLRHPTRLYGVNRSSNRTGVVDGATWLRRWDDQQEGYMANREERFAVILDVVGEVAGGEPHRVLDLGCGPGSLAARVLERFPGVSVVALDNDPVLMLLGRRAYGDHGGRLSWVQADLRSPEWTGAVSAFGRFDAVVSTTALHWLERDALRAAYAGAVAVLEPHGVIVNGDHFFEPSTPG